MKIIKAGLKDLDTVYSIVSEAIRVSYKKCYTDETIEFFLKIHSKERIESDIKNNSTWLIEENGKYIGTGGCKGNYLTRLYILPEYQGRGIGTRMMNFLEEEVKKNYCEAYLTPSALGVELYKRLGYEIIMHEESKMKDGSVLVHDEMKKKLK